MLDIRLILGIGLAVVGLLGYLYVNSLQKQVVNLRKDNTVLVETNKAQEEAKVETERREQVEVVVTHNYDKIRNDNQKEYQRKIDKIDEQVTKGNDRPAGPLLTDFFNGLRNADGEPIN